MGLFNSLFGTYSDKELKRITPIANKVLSLEEKYCKMEDSELKNQTNILKERLANGETLDDILPDAFAVCREASFRVLKMKPFFVQVIGGIVLHQGRIAEMKTGEGKTLVATLPAYLNALSEKGVHIVTVNEYLARRDSEWMGQIYKFLGLSVGLILANMEHSAKQEAYKADITYGTNNEFGFDYLRDNMAVNKDGLVQREFNYAIVDEVDSILIDEARTPLIISGPGEKSTDLYSKADKFSKKLKKVTAVELDSKEQTEDLLPEGDYVVDEKARSVQLTASGIKKAEDYFKVSNLLDADNNELLHHINIALKANGVMKRDVDYVVKNGEVIIVDEFTGRLMIGRRYNEGLHQAIEAKENVTIARENRTLATITFQNFFRMYPKLSGMTGTALTEEGEFREIYKLDVIEVPTNKPVIRIDHEDAIYTTLDAKYRAVVNEVVKAHEKGQPVLVGTVSIDKSERISNMLKARKIPHNVLNAKHHEREAQIVAEAGRFGAVTIATNMAGRGTDIMLGGTDSHRTDEEIQKVKQAGGLYVIGTERHESRRIDNQLRGRSGRQGDPGETRFFLSLEDDLLRLFGGERMQSMMSMLKVDPDQPLEAKMLSSTIENAQAKVEGRNFAARKNVLKFDDVINQQREKIYQQRRAVLDGKDLHETIIKMITEQDPDFLNQYAVKEKKWGHDLTREVERMILLRNVDQNWMEHIDNMEELKNGIYLRGYAQRDPAQEYRIEGSQMYDDMIDSIRRGTVDMLKRVELKKLEGPTK